MTEIRYIQLIKGSESQALPDHTIAKFKQLNKTCVYVMETPPITKV